MMLFKRIPKKMIFIFIGDIFLIKIAQRLNYYMLQRYFYNNIPDLSTRIFTVLIFVFTYYIFDLYDPERNFNSIRYFTKFLCALIVASIVQSVGFYLFFFTQYSRSIFLLNIIGIGFWTYSWRLFLNRFYKRLMPVRKIVIVGAGRAAKTIYNILKGNTNYKIIGFLDDDDEKIGTKIDSVPVIGNMHLIPEIIERQEANIIVLAITYQKKPELFRYM
ncbi:hypothetical protein HY745_14285, partial [Candidatus Desantisbacteria bacterium]|nr:hypothetical protein [Candidatus Desantisbacteria bacterium]